MTRVTLAVGETNLFVAEQCVEPRIIIHTRLQHSLWLEDAENLKNDQMVKIIKRINLGISVEELRCATLLSSEEESEWPSVNRYICMMIKTHRPSIRHNSWLRVSYSSNQQSTAFIEHRWRASVSFPRVTSLKFRRARCSHLICLSRILLKPLRILQ